MSPLALSLVVFGLSSLVSAGLLLRRRTSVVAAVLLGASAAAMILTAVVLANGSDATAMVVGTGGVSVLLVLAVATFPRVRWRHPVDFTALVVLAGCGLVGTAWPVTREIEGLVQGTVLGAYLWWRVETSSGRERRAVVWLAATVALGSLVFATLTFAAEEMTNGLAVGIIFALIGPAMYIGATLPDLVDLRSLVVTATVLAVAVVTYMAVFVMALALLEATGARGLSVGTTALVGALVAATFAPTQTLMRGVVEQLLFGVRVDPLGAASAVAGTLGDDPVRALRAIRESLNLPYAALLVDGTEVAVSGVRPRLTRILDLDGVGSLVVGHRPGDHRLTAADEQVLRLTVPLLAQTLRARALAAELQESRGRTIAAVEDERRRLRRDLHDGLGPRLSGVAFTADAARNLIRVDPGAAEEMVAQLRADTVIAIEEIRRMVYAMRPPALDELGLVPALRQQAVGMRNRDGRPVAVSVSAPELPDLPAAVEVAAYRIATEALANVARHSTSASAAVRIDATHGELRLEVADSGTSDDWRPGVGLASMRERATELGGTLSAGPGPHGGTVSAVLPLQA
jgi:two-component system NarL family sensor kinase